MAVCGRTGAPLPGAVCAPATGAAAVTTSAAPVTPMNSRLETSPSRSAGFFGSVFISWTPALLLPCPRWPAAGFYAHQRVTASLPSAPPYAHTAVDEAWRADRRRVGLHEVHLVEQILRAD